MIFTSEQEQAFMEKISSANYYERIMLCELGRLWEEKVTLAYEDYTALLSHELESDNACVPDDVYNILDDLLTLGERVEAGGACPTEQEITRAGERGLGISFWLGLGIATALGGFMLYSRQR